MSIFSRNGLGVGLALSVLLAAGCGANPEDEAEGADNPDYPKAQITLYSGFDPGGGMDVAINAIMSSLKDGDGVTAPMRIAYQPGGSGLTAVSMMVGDNRGDDDTLLVTSVSTLSASLRQEGVGLKDLTPLGKLFAEYTYLYVRKDSKYQSVADVANAIKANPGGIKISGASLGSADSMVVASFAKALGTSFDKLTYLPLTGGENKTNLLGGQVDVTFGGPDLLDVVASGDVRVLAVSAPERLTVEKVKNIPTFKESGYQVTQGNWRGVFGPPDMPAYAVKWWSDHLSGLGDNTVWQGLLTTNVWDEDLMDSETFKKFLETESESLKGGLTELGLL